MTRCGGNDEVLGDVHAPELVDVGDPRGLASGILAIVRDRENALKRADVVSEKIRAKFSLGSMVEAYAALYDEARASSSL